MNLTNFEINPQATITQSIIAGQTVLVVDDLLQHPELLVNAAVHSQFAPAPGANQAKGYPGIRATAPANYSLRLTAFLEPILRQAYSVPTHLELRKSECAFSLINIAPNDLGPLQRTPHFDSSRAFHIAVLLYLCNEEHGGTAFYQHNSTGITQITETNCAEYMNTYARELNQWRPAPKYFAGSNEYFSQTGFIKARFNRLAIYKGSMLHAVNLNPNLSIDTNPQSGRLTVNSFYDFIEAN